MKENLVVLKVVQDWVIDLNNKDAVLEWNKTVTIGGKYAEIVSTYTDIQVGGLSDEDFAFPKTCTKECSQEEREVQFVQNHYAINDATLGDMV